MEEIIFSESDLAEINALKGGEASFAFCNAFDSEFIVSLAGKQKNVFLSFYGCSFVSGKPQWLFGGLKVKRLDRGFEITDESSGFVIRARDALLLTSEQYINGLKNQFRGLIESDQLRDEKPLIEIKAEKIQVRDGKTVKASSKAKVS